MNDALRMCGFLVYKKKKTCPPATDDLIVVFFLTFLNLIFGLPYLSLWSVPLVRLKKGSIRYLACDYNRLWSFPVTRGVHGGADVSSEKLRAIHYMIVALVV